MLDAGSDHLGICGAKHEFRTPEPAVGGLSGRNVCGVPETVGWGSVSQERVSDARSDRLGISAGQTNFVLLWHKRVSSHKRDPCGTNVQ